MPNWTEAQRSAIEARDRNILVSAAAGSGKTAVLVERVIRMITDKENPVDIDRLLIVTFTNAAATEMKSRISRSLAEIIRNDPNDTNALHQMSILPNARICTIDSFCMNLVREHFYNLGISQDFKIFDESECALVEDNALNEVIESLYVEDKAEFRALLELLSSTKSDANFAKSVKHIYNYIMSQPFPIQWMRDCAALYDPNIPIDSTPLKGYIFGEIKSSVDFAKDIINSTISTINPYEENADVLLDILYSDLGIFYNIDDALNGTWDELYNVINNVSFVAMTRKKCLSKDFVAENRALYRGDNGVFFSDIVPFMSATSEDYRADCEYLCPIFMQLCDVVQMYSEKMYEIKKEMNAFSFFDIEHFAINLLFEYVNGEIKRTELAEDYENNFYEILVDEYQDTNAAQDTLFRMLSNGRNQFMVGDVKQSIYRFRLAMPQIFNAKKNSFTSYSADNTDTDQKIILDRNFRSRKGICDYANFVFSNIMSDKIGELNYGEEEYLNYGADYQPSERPCACISLVNVPDGADSVEYEAQSVARMILDKVNNRELVRDGDTYRPVTFSDFAILFRSTKKSFPVYSKVFSQYGIPVASGNKINLFENNEVAILMSLLRVIDNPMQDVPLLATLMSVFYGYTPDDLASARVAYPSNNLYSSVVADKDRFSAFLDDLNRYREYAASMNVESFIRQIINETSYMSVISAMGNAEQRKLNVLKLVDIARSYDNGESVGLTAFVRYIDSVVKAKLTVESAEITHSGENSVLLMSVHKSKGLEFPICILADASHRYNTSDLSDQIQLNNEFGIGLKVFNSDGLYRYNSIQYNTIRDMNHSAMMSENLRVLYVAITRAKEQFITVISHKNIDSHIANLASKITSKAISPQIVKHISNDGDMVLLTALLHKDGKCLRELSGRDNIFQISDSDIDIQYIAPDVTQETDDEIELQSDPSVVDEIAQKLTFRYERSELSGYISKRAASSLDDVDIGYEYFASSKPAFLSDSGMTPAHRGTAMHTFMQYCDHKLALSDVRAEIGRLLSLGHITTEQADVLDIAKLEAFFRSDLCERLLSADNVFREIKVSSFVPVNLLEDTRYDDSVLVQGIADCVFEEKGELVIVDYKTDRADSEQQLLDRYKNQVGFYVSAVSKVLGKPVKEAMLYSFSLDKCCIYK